MATNNNEIVMDGKIVGLLVIINTLVFSFYWVTTKGTYTAGILGVGALSVFIGLGLMIHDRITEVVVPGVGTIKAAEERATSDAKSIAEIKTRIETQSATVDLVAAQASKAKELSENVEQKLETFSKIINDANATLEGLRTIVAAQNDDRQAFDKLELWAKDKQHPFSEPAAQAWNKIFEEHNKPFFSSGFQVPWKDGIDPSKLSLNDLIHQYQSAPTQIRLALLEYVWQRNDIPKFERLNFMITVMKSDSSLAAVEYAGRYFTQGTNQNIKPLAIEYLTKWWDEHKQEFETNEQKK